MESIEPIDSVLVVELCSEVTYKRVRSRAAKRLGKQRAALRSRSRSEHYSVAKVLRSTQTDLPPGCFVLIDTMWARLAEISIGKNKWTLARRYDVLARIDPPPELKRATRRRR